MSDKVKQAQRYHRPAYSAMDIDVLINFTLVTAQTIMQIGAERADVKPLRCARADQQAPIKGYYAESEDRPWGSYFHPVRTAPDDPQFLPIGGNACAAGFPNSKPLVAELVANIVSTRFINLAFPVVWRVFRSYSFPLPINYAPGYYVKRSEIERGDLSMLLL